MVPQPPPMPAMDGETIDESEESTHIASFEPLDKIRSSYDIVAERYANELADEMIARPIERGIFLAFSELVRGLGDGVVGEVGCGPAHIAKHLTSLGLRMVGIDISVAMVEQARKRFPEGEVFVASMFELPVPSGSWLGAASIWATLHCNASDRMRSFKEIHRVVQPGGYFLHSFYVSAPDQPEGSTYHLQKWFGFAVDLPTYFVGIEDGAAELDAAGFDVMAALVREPMQSNELPTRRCYMLGKRR
jgi:SAM-dependent methyltransferase